MLNILITGFRGRMGQAVATAVSECEETRVAAGIDLGDSLEEALKRCDLVIDFTLPSFTNELIEGCVESGIPLVMGTTGHDDKQLDLILTASHRITITAITATTITTAVRGGTIGIVITVVDGGVEVRVPRVNRRHNVQAADRRT